MNIYFQTIFKYFCCFYVILMVSVSKESNSNCKASNDKTKGWNIFRVFSSQKHTEEKSLM